LQTLTAYSATDKKQSYQELERENERLRRTISLPTTFRRASDEQLTSRPSSDQDVDSGGDFVQDIDLDRCENYLFLHCPQPSRPGPYNNVPIIQLPSRECSKAIVRYGEIWISWVHFALDQDKFGEEHEAFWNSLAHGGETENHEPLWLAIYFSFLTVSKSCLNVLFLLTVI
jgi:hypothetical protein